jgi:hypothetical protein
MRLCDERRQERYDRVLFPGGGGAIALHSEPAVARVLVIDEQEIVRRGVTGLLHGQAGITVVGEAASVAAALAIGPAVRPDVAVLGMCLPDGSGAETKGRRSLTDHTRTLWGLLRPRAVVDRERPALGPRHDAT